MIIAFKLKEDRYFLNRGLAKTYKTIVKYLSGLNPETKVLSIKTITKNGMIQVFK